MFCFYPYVLVLTCSTLGYSWKRKCSTMNGDLQEKESMTYVMLSLMFCMNFPFRQVFWAKLFTYNLLLKPRWAWNWMYFKIILINLNKCYLLNIVIFIWALEFLKMLNHLDVILTSLWRECSLYLTINVFCRKLGKQPRSLEWFMIQSHLMSKLCQLFCFYHESYVCMGGCVYTHTHIYRVVLVSICTQKCI